MMRLFSGFSLRRVWMKMRGEFASHVASRFSTQLLIVFLSIAQAAIIARWLGPQGKGVLFLILLVPNMISTFLSCGIGVSNVYFAGKGLHDVETLTGHSITFALLATLFGVLTVGGLALSGFLEILLPGVPLPMLLVALSVLPALMLVLFFSTILQGLQKIHQINIAHIVQYTVMLVLTAVLVIACDAGLWGALLAALASSVLGAGLLGFLLFKQGGRLAPKWDPATARAALAFGLKGHVGNVLQFFNYRFDMFIANFFIGAAGVGLYTVSVRLAELLWHLPNAVGFIIFPKAASSTPEHMNRITPRIFLLTLCVTSVGAVALALVGRWLIRLIYSSAFTEAYLPLLALLPGVVLLGAAKVLTNEMAGRGYPQYNSFNAAIAVVLTVSLDLLLIPRYGVLGAAVASSVAYVVVAIAAVIFYGRVVRRQRVSPTAVGQNR